MTLLFVLGLNEAGGDDLSIKNDDDDEGRIPTDAEREKAEPCFILASHTKLLVQALHLRSQSQLKKMLRLDNTGAELNFNRFQSFEDQHANPAMLIGSGETFTGLAGIKFDAAQRKFAQKHVRIISGLYGLLRPCDLIRPHRLPFGAALRTGRGKDLSAFWGSTITNALNKAVRSAAGAKEDGACEGGTVCTVINCAPRKDFALAVQTEDLDASVVHCEFREPPLEASGSRGRPVGLAMQQRARGMLCRYVVIRGVTDVQRLKAFGGASALERYRYSEALSDEPRLLVFVHVATKPTKPQLGSRRPEKGGKRRTQVKNTSKVATHKKRPRVSKKKQLRLPHCKR